MSVDVGGLLVRVLFGAIAAHRAQKVFGSFGGYALKGTGGFFETLGFRPDAMFAAMNKPTCAYPATNSLMSALNESQNAAVGRTSRQAVRGASSSFVTRALTLLSSVRFGIILLIFLVLASMTGMLIMQENVDGFDKYFAELTPAQQLIWAKLGFFDIYHTWYFNALLLVLSINIILASIDRFPNAWSFISRKKLDASRKWLIGQATHECIDLGTREVYHVADRVAKQFNRAGLKPVITEKGGELFVFGEGGAWNRLGAYTVHVGLLTIFVGGFLTAQFGREGQMRLEPGNTSSQLGVTGDFWKNVTLRRSKKVS